MKRYLLGVICVLVLFMVSEAGAWDPNGTWVNLDSDSGGIHSLVINYPYIRGYGQCTPNPCDWGYAGYTSKLVASGDKTDDDRVEYMAVWAWSFALDFIFISPHPENPDYIIVKTYTLYDVLGDPRENRYKIEYLKRQ